MNFIRVINPLLLTKRDAAPGPVVGADDEECV